MPKVRLAAEQVGELIDTLYGEIDTLRKQRGDTPDGGPDNIESSRRESVLLEILEILEDAQ